MHYTLPSPGPKVETVDVALTLWHANVTPVGAQASSSSLANMSGLSCQRMQVVRGGCWGVSHHLEGFRNLEKGCE